METATTRTAFEAFYENLAQTQSDQDYYLHPVGMARRKAILELLQARPGERIGDLGCGEGLLALRLQADGRRIIGCDCSPTRVKRAAANGVEAVTASIEDMPFPDDWFDRIICSEVLEHLTDPSVALREISRVLRPGGVAVLTVPLDERLETTLLDVPEAALAQMPYREIKRRFQLVNDHLAAFSEGSFKRLLMECDLAVESCAFTYNYSVKHPRLLRIARKAYWAIAGDRPAALLSQLAEALVRPWIFLSCHRQDRKHHIVVRARAVRAARNEQIPPSRSKRRPELCASA